MDNTLYSKEKRNELHKVFDTLWTTYDERTEAYRKLSMKLGIKKEYCHFSKFWDKDWERVEKAVYEMKYPQKRKPPTVQFLSREETMKALEIVKKENNRRLFWARVLRFFRLSKCG